MGRIHLSSIGVCVGEHSTALAHPKSTPLSKANVCQFLSRIFERVASTWLRRFTRLREFRSRMRVSGLKSAGVSKLTASSLSRQYYVEGSPSLHRTTELCPKRMQIQQCRGNSAKVPGTQVSRKRAQTGGLGSVPSEACHRRFGQKPTHLFNKKTGRPTGSTGFSNVNKVIDQLTCWPSWLFSRSLFRMLCRKTRASFELHRPWLRPLYFCSRRSKTQLRCLQC